MKKGLIILAALTVLAICSCTSKIQDFEYNAIMIMPEGAELQQIEQKLNNNETEERKIIKEGRIKFQTADVNKTKALIEQAVQELNGYIAKDEVYDYGDNRLEHSLTIRIPAGKFDLLLTTVSNSIDLLDSKTINVLDVTEEYIDIETRIKTKKELQIRYTELLRQATKVEEMLQIEKELGMLQAELESVEGRMRFLTDRIAFSTLTVTYYQTQPSQFAFFSKLVDGIKKGWHVFLWFIIGLAHVWVFILVAVAMIFLFRLWKKKRKKKYA